MSGTRLLIIAFPYSRQELLNWSPAPNWCDIQLQLLQWKTLLNWTPAPNWCDIQLQLLQWKTGRTALQLATHSTLACHRKAWLQKSTIPFSKHARIRQPLNRFTIAFPNNSIDFEPP